MSCITLSICLKIKYYLSVVCTELRYETTTKKYLLYIISIIYILSLHTVMYINIVGDLS